MRLPPSRSARNATKAPPWDGPRVLKASTRSSHDSATLAYMRWGRPHSACTPDGLLVVALVVALVYRCRGHAGAVEHPAVRATDSSMGHPVD